MYLLTQQYLAEHGYHRYEISNYAKEGRECRHNKVYWQRGNYLGVGLGAASMVENVRWSNPSEKEAYRVCAGRSGFPEGQALTEQEQMEAILRVHFGDLEEKLVKQSLAAFYWLRELRGIEKKPSTSELVDWIRALVAGGVDPARIEKEIPFAGVLLKKDKDLQTLRKVK